MAKCVFFFIALVVFLQNVALSKKHSGRSLKVAGGKIVGGYNTTIQDYPYQALLIITINGDMYQCGGSIISRRYVLTAAHCLKGASGVYVRTGSTNSESGGRLYYTLSYKIHPKYSSRNSDYDVAYVDLKRNIDLDGKNTKAVKLAPANSKVEPGTEIVISGWGDTTEGGSTSTTLMAVKVPTVSTEDCKKSYSQITSRMFCAGNPEGGKDSCQGDSGGPAVATESGVQLGIVSFGVGCGRPGIPGVYTNISHVRDWIQTNTGV